MPCNQAQEVTVAFSQATDLDALALALEGLGYRDVRREGDSLYWQGGNFSDKVLIVFKTSELSLARGIEALKRAYTKATTLVQADRFGWAVKAKAKAVVGFSRAW